MSVSPITTKAEVYRSNIEANDFDERSSKGRSLCRSNFLHEADIKTFQELRVRSRSYQLKYIAVAIPVGAALGGVFGGVITQNPLGVAGGVLVGCAVGGLVGIGLGRCHHEVTILKSDQYKRWKLQAINKKVYNYFVLFIQTKKEFTELLCPLSKIIPTLPVKAPCGHVYDAEALNIFLISGKSEIDRELQSLKDKNLSLNKLQEESHKIKSRACNLKCRYFTLQDCIIDDESMSKIHRVISAIQNSPASFNDKQLIFSGVDELERDKMATVAKEGLKSIDKDIVENTSVLFENRMNSVARQIIDKNLDEETAIKVFREFYKHERQDFKKNSPDKNYEKSEIVLPKLEIEEVSKSQSIIELIEEITPKTVKIDIPLSKAGRSASETELAKAEEESKKNIEVLESAREQITAQESVELVESSPKEDKPDNDVYESDSDSESFSDFEDLDSPQTLPS